MSTRETPGDRRERARRLRFGGVVPLAGGATVPADAAREVWASALCAQVDPELFFPEKGQPSAPAKAVCARCPVTALCLATFGPLVDRRRGRRADRTGTQASSAGPNGRPRPDPPCRSRTGCRGRRRGPGPARHTRKAHHDRQDGRRRDQRARRRDQGRGPVRDPRRPRRVGAGQTRSPGRPSCRRSPASLVSFVLVGLPPDRGPATRPEPADRPPAPRRWGPPVLHTRAARPTPSRTSTTKGAPIMAARFHVPTAPPRPSSPARSAGPGAGPRSARSGPADAPAGGPAGPAGPADLPGRATWPPTRCRRPRPSTRPASTTTSTTPANPPPSCARSTPSASASVPTPGPTWEARHDRPGHRPGPRPGHGGGGRPGGAGCAVAGGDRGRPGRGDRRADLPGSQLDARVPTPAAGLRAAVLLSRLFTGEIRRQLRRGREAGRHAADCPRRAAAIADWRRAKDAWDDVDDGDAGSDR